MTDKLKVFLSIAGIIGGLVLLANLNILHSTFWWHWNNEATEHLMSWDHVIQAIAGIVLIALGSTYFWTRSRFYRP